MLKEPPLTLSIKVKCLFVNKTQRVYGVMGEHLSPENELDALALSPPWFTFQIERKTYGGTESLIGTLLSTSDWPESPLKTKAAEWPVLGKLYSIQIDSVKNTLHAEYYLQQFFNWMKLSNIFDEVTEDERKIFKRLGYALLCILLSRLPKSARRLTLQTKTFGVEKYYKELGFTRSEAQNEEDLDYGFINMVADIDTLRKLCDEKAKNVERYVKVEISDDRPDQ